MEYVIFSDIHGKSLKPLEERLKKYGAPENLKLICMGDFDDADVIKEARDLIRKYNGTVVPGNHDEMLVRKFVDFESGTFGPGKTAFHYALKLHDDPVALNYLSDLLKQQMKLLQIVSEYGQTNTNFSNAVVVHGGLAGDLHSALNQEGVEKLWYRIYLKEVLCDDSAERNFQEMKRIGCNIMIRGHDHVQSYAYKRENGGIDAKAKLNGVYRLFPSRMHIINPGSYFEGDYAVINTESLIPKLSFHNLNKND